MMKGLLAVIFGAIRGHTAAQPLHLTIQEKSVTVHVTK